MAQRYDVSLKALFLQEGNGIIRRLLFGGSKITEFLSTEQPQVFNPRVDLLARTESGGIRQVEFQTTNETGFPFRMFEYYPYLVRMYGEPVTQVVLYLGREPLRMENYYRSASVDYRFEMINLREWDAAPLLASDDLADNILALLAKGSPEEALRIVIPRIAALRGDERNPAEASLVLLSGIIGMEDVIQHRFKEFGVINVMENKILGPMMIEKFEQGKREILRSQCISKFGTFPLWAEKRLTGASDEELDAFAQRILSAATLEETLR